MKGRWVTADYLEPDFQRGINHGINMFGAQLFAESLEDKPSEVQEGGLTVVVRDHNKKVWYITASTKQPEIIE